MKSIVLGAIVSRIVPALLILALVLLVLFVSSL